MSTLNPCANCGESRDLLRITTGGVNPRYAICCENCSTTSKFLRSTADAEEQWNSQNPEEAQNA